MIRKLKNFYHLIVAILMNVLFLFPGRKLKVIGATGTDGKTTTASLIYHILKENGKKTSLLTSIGAFIGEKEYQTGFHVTTPNSFSLQRFLRKAVRAKTEYFVLEVTSHAIDQERIWGIPFKIGVLTNVTSEHLDYHKTFDNYLKTKEKLLKIAGIAIVNIDDGSYSLLKDAKNKKNNKDWITYGFSKNANINLVNSKFDSEVLLGDFNKHNALAAIAVCRILGLNDKDIDSAIKTFKMPTGRLDYVYNKDFSVLIDFAHTPNAFEQLLSSLKPIVKGRLIHVFGSAGERDQIKRPLMGKISGKFADVIILTAEDPRSEDENDIIEEIAKGVRAKDKEVLRIPDRKDAINKAIKMAKPGDLVVITGKAHEKSMTYGNKDLPWDEYKIVENAIKARQ